MKKKLNLGIIFGGTNTEHEVSIVSARSIINNLNPNKYSLSKIKIEKDGTWNINGSRQPTPPNWKKLNIVFPILHGPFGEDGTIQGMLELAQTPYVGCGVLSSAICMDKVIQKQICSTVSIPIPKYAWTTTHNWRHNQSLVLDQIKLSLKYPLFIKPANQGSSIGVSRVNNQKELIQSINHTLELDQKAIIEQAIPDTREIECSVLGNEDPKASVLGEIIPSNEFYDYDAKYTDGSSQEVIPAKLSKKTSGEIRALAIKSFKILNCSGLARIDFLYNDENGKYYLNELNTMPGFTSISMYPKLWQASGIGYSELLDKLIELALDRHKSRSQLSFSYKPKKNWYR